MLALASIHLGENLTLNPRSRVRRDAFKIPYVTKAGLMLPLQPYRFANAKESDSRPFIPRIWGHFERTESGLAAGQLALLVKAFSPPISRR